MSKSNPTPKQLAARKLFKERTAKARKMIDSGQAKNVKEAFSKLGFSKSSKPKKRGSTNKKNTKRRRK